MVEGPHRYDVPDDIILKLLAKIAPLDENGHCLWRGSSQASPQGNHRPVPYFNFGRNGQKKLYIRPFLWDRFVKPLPITAKRAPRIFIVCNEDLCVNIDHLSIRDPRSEENTYDYTAKPRGTHCQSCGQPYEEGKFFWQMITRDGRRRAHRRCSNCYVNSVERRKARREQATPSTVATKERKWAEEARQYIDWV